MNKAQVLQRLPKFDKNTSFLRRGSSPLKQNRTGPIYRAILDQSDPDETISAIEPLLSNWQYLQKQRETLQHCCEALVSLGKKSDQVNYTLVEFIFITLAQKSSSFGASLLKPWIMLENKGLLNHGLMGWIIYELSLQGTSEIENEPEQAKAALTSIFNYLKQKQPSFLNDIKTLVVFAAAQHNHFPFITENLDFTDATTKVICSFLTQYIDNPPILNALLKLCPENLSIEDPHVLDCLQAAVNTANPECVNVLKGHVKLATDEEDKEGKIQTIVLLFSAWDENALNSLDESFIETFVTLSSLNEDHKLVEQKRAHIILKLENDTQLSAVEMKFAQAQVLPWNNTIKQRYFLQQIVDTIVARDVKKAHYLVLEKLVMVWAKDDKLSQALTGPWKGINDKGEVVLPPLETSLMRELTVAAAGRSVSAPSGGVAPKESLEKLVATQFSMLVKNPAECIRVIERCVQQSPSFSWGTAINNGTALHPPLDALGFINRGEWDRFKTATEKGIDVRILSIASHHVIWCCDQVGIKTLIELDADRWENSTASGPKHTPMRTLRKLATSKKPIQGAKKPEEYRVLLHLFKGLMSSLSIIKLATQLSDELVPNLLGVGGKLDIDNDLVLKCYEDLAMRRESLALKIIEHSTFDSISASRAIKYFYHSSHSDTLCNAILERRKDFDFSKTQGPNTLLHLRTVITRGGLTEQTYKKFTLKLDLTNCTRDQLLATFRAAVEGTKDDFMLLYQNCGTEKFKEIIFEVLLYAIQYEQPEIASFIIELNILDKMAPSSEQLEALVEACLALPQNKVGKSRFGYTKAAPGMYHFVDVFEQLGEWLGEDSNPYLTETKHTNLRDMLTPKVKSQIATPYSVLMMRALLTPWKNSNLQKQTLKTLYLEIVKRGDDAKTHMEALINLADRLNTKASRQVFFIIIDASDRPKDIVDQIITHANPDWSMEDDEVADFIVRILGGAKYHSSAESLANQCNWSRLNKETVTQLQTTINKVGYPVALKTVVEAKLKTAEVIRTYYLYQSPAVVIQTPTRAAQQTPPAPQQTPPAPQHTTPQQQLNNKGSAPRNKTLIADTKTLIDQWTGDTKAFRKSYSTLWKKTHSPIESVRRVAKDYVKATGHAKRHHRDLMKEIYRFCQGGKGKKHDRIIPSEKEVLLLLFDVKRRFKGKIDSSTKHFKANGSCYHRLHFMIKRFMEQTELDYNVVEQHDFTAPQR